MLNTHSQCRVLQFPVINDPRGNLTFIEGQEHAPFEIRRVYYLYDVPGGAERGGHAHRSLFQILIAISGSFDVHINNGEVETVFTLNRSYSGLLIPPRHWRELKNFSSGSVCLVLASEVYQEEDYLRDFSAFLDWVRDT